MTSDEISGGSPASEGPAGPSPEATAATPEGIGEARGSGPPPGPPPGGPPRATPGPVTRADEPRPSTPFEWFGTRAGRQTLVVMVVAIALVIGILVAGSNKSSGSTSASGQIFLTPADSPGDNAFTPSVAKAFAVGEATTTTTPAPPSTMPGAVSSISGATVGLYGGTLHLSSCNAQQMVHYLVADPALGRAWAEAEGIPYEALPAYIDSLTPVILRADTQVTNHGYVDGVANPIPEILQAGTAVLVDAYGVPRARCFCGNPLTPPVPTTVTPSYVGPHWPGFSPVTVVVVVAAPTPVTTFTLVDTNTGQTFVRPVGTDGASDSPSGSAPTTSNVAPSGATTTTTLPTGLTSSGTPYSLTFSSPQLSGTTSAGAVTVTSTDCQNLLSETGATANAGVGIAGSSIAFSFSNILLTGTYNPDGSFNVSTTEPYEEGQLSGTAVVAMTGTISQGSITDGQFSETLTPPGAKCSYTMTGQVVSVTSTSSTTTGNTGNT